MRCAPAPAPVRCPSPRSIPQTLVEAVGVLHGDAAADASEEPPNAVFASAEYAVVASSAMLESTEEGDGCPNECSFELHVQPAAPAISTMPTMPTITATVTKVSPADATASWSAQIAYTPFLNPASCSNDPTTSFDSSRVTGSGKSFSRCGCGAARQYLPIRGRHRPFLWAEAAIAAVLEGLGLGSWPRHRRVPGRRDPPRAAGRSPR